MKVRKAALVLAIIGLWFASTGLRSKAEEGMYPISELAKLDLRAKGLAISPEEIFSPDRPSLIFAIVSVGATGSFVSPDGLIVTNHHVAFSAVQRISTPERDYLTNGFLAPTRAEEISARGMTARITESFRDVSAEVLAAVRPEMSLADRTRAIDRRSREIVAEAERSNPGKRAEVAEMFRGRTYVLFLYTTLRDIRIVYVPPLAIGNFGGEIDNWMWPRHTGDFTFLRAYTAPDGSPAEFSPTNVPFKPKRFLRINPDGVKEGDFIFLLGYPGRTYRHTTASYMAYEEEVRMPYVADWYAWQIALMEKRGEGDPAVALKLASRIKGLANTMKNYRGKLQGMKRVGIVANRLAEEKELEAYIAADAGRRAKYGEVIPAINKVYEEQRARFETDMVLGYLRSSVQMINWAMTAWGAAIERAKPDLERESGFMDRNWARTKQRVALTQRSYDEEIDKAVLKELIKRALGLSPPLGIPGLEAPTGGNVPEAEIEAYVGRAYASSRLQDEKVMAELIEKADQANGAELMKTEAAKDPFLSFAASLYPHVQELREVQRAREGALGPLYARLSEIKEAWIGTSFIPDANSTLRLTYGRIKGYSPADAVIYRPFTTLGGVVEKTTGAQPFNTPPRVVDLWKAKDFGRFAHPGLKDVPACMLYDADTTGGNSGSPVLNARGELVGINFDRTFEATINDFAWNEEYSRSIAVDIRYVLWVAQKFGGATDLLAEIGIN